ncbi:hypothetical protein L596_007461 [Steinernema carpocapsae]|uniref:ZP domain-containing protein n=1 Tax=Steinernema carpocapsae TaxID=34508 RepID=A0A4V6A600_STECR|nr:hypothetical protein L596_007461 [Steinernema carpocapsae]
MFPGTPPEVSERPTSPNFPNTPEIPPSMPPFETPRTPMTPEIPTRVTPPPEMPSFPPTSFLPKTPPSRPSFPSQPPMVPSQPIPPEMPSVPERTPSPPTPPVPERTPPPPEPKPSEETFPPFEMTPPTPPTPRTSEVPMNPPTFPTRPPFIQTSPTPRIPPSVSTPPLQTPRVPPSSPTPLTNRTMVPNRVRGKAHVICEEESIQFRVTTLFPFTGQIFAHDRKRVPSCVHTFSEATLVNITFPYQECGIKNAGNQSAQTQFHMQIIVVFEQPDGSSTIQSFISQCLHQKIQYQKQQIPKRIEEALEELHLIPTKLEQKAPIPECRMKIVKEVEHGHEGDGEEVIDSVDLGQPLRIEWSLVPESDAYGFHVRNCTVKDLVSGIEHSVIDERGCSTDINIFAHPHYDTYHDVARVHWHAFKVPDNSQLSIRCNFQICSDIADSNNGLTSCDSIPSPPFCPDLITSPSNSILFDINGNLVEKRSVLHRNPADLHQQVHASICFGTPNDEFCDSQQFEMQRRNHLRSITASERYCVSRMWLSIVSGTSLWTTLISIGVNFYCRFVRRRRASSNPVAAHMGTH